MPRRDFDQVSYDRSVMQQDLRRVRGIYKEGALTHARKKAAQKKVHIPDHRLKAEHILRTPPITNIRKVERLKKYLTTRLSNPNVLFKDQRGQEIELDAFLRAIESRDRFWIVLESGHQLNVAELNGSPIKWSAVRGIFVEKANAERFIKEAEERRRMVKSDPSNEFDQAASNV